MNPTQPLWSEENEAELQELEGLLGVQASQAPPTPMQQQQEEQQAQQEQGQVIPLNDEEEEELAKLEALAGGDDSVTFTGTEQPTMEQEPASMPTMEDEEANKAKFIEEKSDWIDEGLRATAKGFSIGVGAIADIPNMIIETATLGKSREWGIGAGMAEDAIADTIEAATGVSTETDNSLSSAIITEFVANLSGFGVFGAAGKVSSGAESAKILTEMSADFSRAVTTSLGLSIAGGTGRKYGGDIAEEMGADRETGEAIGSLAGNLTPMVGAVAYNKARNAARGMNETFGITPNARKQLASRIMRESASDQENLAKLSTMSQKELNQTGLPNTGQLIDDAGVMSTQKKLEGAQDLSIQGKAAAKKGLQRSDLMETLDKLRPTKEGSQGVIAKAVTTRINKTIDTLQSKALAFQYKSQKALDDLAVKYPNEVIPEEYVQVIAQQHVDDLVKTISKEETKLWNSIGDGKFAVDDLASYMKSAVKESTKGIGKADKKLLAAYDKMQKFADKGKGMRIDDIKLIRTELNERIAMLDKKKQFSKSRILKKVRDDMLNRLTPLKGDVDMEAYKKAREFTSSMYTKIRDTGVGKMIDKTSGKQFRTTPEKAIDSLNIKGQDGLKALDDMKLAIRELHPDHKAATEAIAKLDNQVQDYIKIQYLMAPNKKSFLKQWRHPINRYPDLKPQLEDSAYMAEMAKQVGVTVEKRVARLKKFRNANNYLQEDVQQSVLEAMKNKDHLTATKNLMRRAQQDKTGEAVEGVRSAWYEGIYDRVVTTVDDQPSIKHEELAGILRYYGKDIKEVFGEDGFKVLKAVERGARMNARQGHGASLAGEQKLMKSQSKMKNLAGNTAVFIGTKLHKMFGIGVNELLFAGMARGMGKNAVSRLFDEEMATVHGILEEALLNPVAAKQLMELKPLTPIGSIKEPLRSILLIDTAREIDELGDQLID